MADEVQATVDDRAVRDLFTSWDSAVGEAVQEVVDEIEAIAFAAAPISEVGSKFSPPGHLKAFTRQSIEHHYDDATGEVLGLIGAPAFPYSFIASKSGFTHNPRSGRHPGRGSVRKADDDYLQRAIDAAPELTIGEPELWPARWRRPGYR